MNNRVGISLMFVVLLGAACGDESPTGTVDASTDGSVASVDAGADASTATTFPTGTSVSAEAAAIAAARLTSCIPDDPAQSTIRGLYRKLTPPNGPLQLSDEVVNCLATATDGCASVVACTGINFDLQGPCAPSCTGDVLTVCDDDWRFQFDCSTQGLECDPVANSCLDPANSCTGDIRCEQGVPTGCSDGATRTGFTCEQYGLTCDVESPGCQGTSGTCDSGGSSAYGVEAIGLECVNSMELRACVNNGEHTILCSDIAPGMSCHTRLGQSYCGLGDTCDPFIADSASCDNDSLVLCSAGKTITVDCTAAGFKGCSEGGRDGAFCSPSPWLSR